MKRNKQHTVVCFILVALFCLKSGPVFAFNPHNILTDEELKDVDTMNQNDIQAFLEQAGSSLATYTCPGGKRAAAVIATASADYQVNPRVLLVLLQKEQSLIEGPPATRRQFEWATGYGVCDACRLNDPGIQKFRGFETQVRSAAELLRGIVDNPQRSRIRKGAATLIDKLIVTPLSQATAALYAYTPHLQGNKVFWALYTRWFRKQYPDGSLIKSPTQAIVWLLQYGTRRPIRSMAVLRSRFGNQSVISTATIAEIEKYPIGPAIGFSNYSLIRTPNGMIALLDGDQYRPIASMAVFRSIGFNPEEVEDIESSSLQGYTRGNLITESNIYPTGALMKDTTTNLVYFVNDNIRHAIVDQSILETRYPRRAVTRTTSETLKQFPIGDPVLLPDGTLIKEKKSPIVYVISESKRHVIPTELTFKTLGYQWSAIRTVPTQVVLLHPLGAPIDVATPDIPTSDPRPQLR